MRLLDSPLVFIIIMTIIVLAVAHLLHILGNATNFKGLSEFASLPS